MITFRIESGGKPENHELLSWLSSQERPGYPTVANGRACQWTGCVEAIEVPCEPELRWDGSLLYRKFQLPSGRQFYYGFHQGNARRFDRAVIKIR